MNKRVLLQLLAIPAMFLMLGACAPLPDSNGYVLEIGDGLFGKSWAYVDSKGKEHKMKSCPEARSFFSKSCVVNEDSDIRFEWIEWRDSVRAGELTVDGKTRKVTCDRGPLGLTDLTCSPSS